MKIALITGSCGLVGSESAAFFSKKGFKIIFDESIRGVAPGQSAVFYNDNICLESST